MLYDSFRIIYSFVMFTLVELPFKTALRASGVFIFAFYAVGLLPLCILSETMLGEYETPVHALADKVNGLSEILVNMGDISTNRIFDWWRQFSA